MLRMIDVDMNIDYEGKEEGDPGLDQEVEIEEEVEAGPHIEDTDIINHIQ